MARPRKDAVEYFPHFVNWGKTIPILESKFGNDGYAVWFKILETLGKTSGHSYDCSDAMDWEFLVQKLRVSEDTATEIIELLCKLGAIDADLWREERTIWSDNFVTQLSPVYTKRKVSAPEKPTSGSFCSGNPDIPEVNPPEMRHRREEESRGEESKGENTGDPQADAPPVVLARPRQKKKVVEMPEMPESLKALPGLPEAWEKWRKHRAESKKAITSTTAEYQFRELLKSPNPLAMIEHSIAKGYSGLYDPKPMNGMNGTNGQLKQSTSDYIPR